MTQHESDRLKVLQKRLDWLTKRIYTDSEDKTGLSYDRQEASALEWAIKIIEKNLGINDTPEGCKHTYNLRNNNEVFCIKCLEIKVFNI